jgi:hypothetical protein
MEHAMPDLVFFACAIAGGYVLSIYTWPELRTFLVGMDRELVRLKERAAAIEARLRAALGRGQH